MGKACRLLSKKAVSAYGGYSLLLKQNKTLPTHVTFNFKMICNYLNLPISHDELW